MWPVSFAVTELTPAKRDVYTAGVSYGGGKNTALKAGVAGEF